MASVGPGEPFRRQGFSAKSPRSLSTCQLLAQHLEVFIVDEPYERADVVDFKGHDPGGVLLKDTRLMNPYRFPAGPRLSTHSLTIRRKLTSNLGARLCVSAIYGYASRSP